MSQSLRKTINGVVLCLFSALSLLIVYGIATGLPITVGSWIYRAKSFKVLSIGVIILWVLHLALDAEGPKKGLLKFKNSVELAAQKPFAIWLIFFIAGILFTWQQVAEYLSININFLPFSFYDYSLFYFFQGKVHFTGWLHGYYHHNLIMFLLAPIWKLFQSPLILVLTYGFIASACIFPLHAIARERFKEPVAPFFIILTFLSYGYLRNALLVNFSVEICYPLFVFSAVYFTMKRRWPLYYLFLFLELLVKEDSFIYAITLGLFTFFYRDRDREKNGIYRIHGIITTALAVCYVVFLRLIYSPLIGSDIMYGNYGNYIGYGNSVREIALRFLGTPWLFFTEFFGSKVKLQVLLKTISKLAFLPLFSPAVGLMFFSMLPLFLHNTGRDADFVEMRFYYGLPVLPFIFIAAVFGFSNLLGRIPARFREIARWLLCVALITTNVGNFRTEKITSENLTSIAWAKGIPPGVLVTHGHLLPYVGYREHNFYFAEPFALKTHPSYPVYSDPDFYLIDLTVNPYPMNRDFFVKTIADLKMNPNYSLVKQDRDVRFIFKRKSPEPRVKIVPGYPKDLLTRSADTAA